MSRPLSHAELRELLPAAALDVLGREEGEQVRLHLAACADCVRELESYRRVTADLAFSVESRDLAPDRRAAVRDRLLARVRAEPREEAALAPARLPTRFLGPWPGWLVAAGLAGVLLMHHAVHRPLDYGWFAAGALLVALLTLGCYAGLQRRRLQRLRQRLAEAEGRAPRSSAGD